MLATAEARRLETAETPPVGQEIYSESVYGIRRRGSLVGRRRESRCRLASTTTCRNG